MYRIREIEGINGNRFLRRKRDDSVNGNPNPRCSIAGTIATLAYGVVR
jgi:hypothetical protein